MTAVTISSDGEPFKGFITQARLAFPDSESTAGPSAEQAFGEFTPDDGGFSRHNCANFHVSDTFSDTCSI